MICPNCNADFDADHCPECGIAVRSASDDRIAAAAALLQEGLADQAIEALEQVIAANPGSFDAHALLGAAYLRQGDADLAGHHCERAVWLDSGSAAARYHLALAYRAAGRLQEAGEQARAALAKDSQHRQARTLLRQLEHGPSLEAPPPGSPQNRQRAAAPHLEAVHVPSRRLPYPALIAVGAVAAALIAFGGMLAYGWVFRFLTSPQLTGREAALWAQLPYAAGVAVFVAGVVAATFQAPGFPLAGLVGCLVALPLGVGMLLQGEQVPLTPRIIAEVAVGGAVGGAAVEALAKFTPLGGFRGTLIWVSVIGIISFVGASYARQGSLAGQVVLTLAPHAGEVVEVRVPDAEIILHDPRTGQIYTTTSSRGEDHPAERGTYALRGMPVGNYLMTVFDHRTGGSWQGEVYVDYAIIRGNNVPVALSVSEAPGHHHALQ